MLELDPDVASRLASPMHDDGAFAAAFFLLAIGTVIVVPFVLAIRRRRSVTTLPTIGEYLEANPSCKKGDRVACNRCGGTNIHLWWLRGPQTGTGPKKHLCRTCGTALWKSNS